MGCWKQRGDTQCVGDSLPFQVGSCQCISGYCNSDGKCSVTMGFKGQASSGYTAFGRLFEEKDAPILPEDHSFAIAAYVITSFSMVTLITFLVMRIRRQGVSHLAPEDAGDPAPFNRIAQSDFLMEEVEGQME
ncbi:unnamed protein product [Durusdinium trenchii]|uniref:Uncharacterized protein n=2 Tax=Durusdinium trenchii TaxID=1381693 RepID=A0ABP0KYH3_9DINO